MDHSLLNDYLTKVETSRYTRRLTCGERIRGGKVKVTTKKNNSRGNGK